MRTSDPVISNSSERERPAAVLWLLTLLILAAIYIPSVVTRGPWLADDMRYAEVARQMGEYGNLLVPHTNGEVYAEKPPLFFWAIQLVHPLAGDWFVATKITALLAGLLGVLLVGGIAHTLFGDRRTAALATLLCGTTVMILDRGQRPVIDTFLFPWTVAAVLGLLRSATATSARSRSLSIGIAALGMTGACMTKGPVGLFLAAIGALATGLVWRGRRGVSWSALGISVLVAAAVTLGWVWLASREVGEWFWERMVFKQTVGRARHAFDHAQPWYYYLRETPKYALPWLVLAPGALWIAWRERSEGPHRDAARAALGAAAWLLIGLIAMSLFSGKRTAYVMPLYPALALLCAHGLRRFEDGATAGSALLGAPIRVLTPALFILAAAALLTPLGTSFVSAESLSRSSLRLAEAMPAHWWWTPVACGTLFFLVALAARRRTLTPIAPVLGLCTAAAIAFACASVTVLPAYDAARTLDRFGQSVATALPPDERLVMGVQSHDGRVHMYTRAEHYDIIHPALIAPELNQPGRLWLVINRRDVPLLGEHGLRFEPGVPEETDDALLLMRER